tara:strand:+ start:33382 stop:34047 length:666 start_codon:yes stop_codon:yes gene_type:complete
MISLTPVLIVRPFNLKNSLLFFNVFAFVCSKLLGVKLTIEGKEKIFQHRPAILVGNHQHNFDILSVAPLKTHFIVLLAKWELSLIPYFGQFYILCGHILIKRKNHKKAMNAMDKVYQKLKEDKLSIIIFPEGHRNPTKDLLPFKKGAFHTAIRTGIPLLPFGVSQYCVYKQFEKGGKRHIHIHVGDPIYTNTLTKLDIPELMQKTKTEIEKNIQIANKVYQ